MFAQLRTGLTSIISRTLEHFIHISSIQQWCILVQRLSVYVSGWWADSVYLFVYTSMYLGLGELMGVGWGWGAFSGSNGILEEFCPECLLRDREANKNRDRDRHTDREKQREKHTHTHRGQRRGGRQIYSDQRKGTITKFWLVLFSFLSLIFLLLF